MVAESIHEQLTLQSSGIRPLAVYIVIATPDSIHSIDCFGEVWCYGDMYSSTLAYPITSGDSDSDDDTTDDRRHEGERDDKFFTLLSDLSKSQTERTQLVHTNIILDNILRDSDKDMEIAVISDKTQFIE